MRGDCDSHTRIASVETPDNWIQLDEFLSRKRNESLVREAIAPPPISPMSIQKSAHRNGTVPGAGIKPSTVIQSFPILPLLLLHVLTLGVFTFVWVLSRHGILPKFRADAINAGKAFGLLLVPFYHLYWLVFVFYRLAKRCNEFAHSLDVRGDVSTFLAAIVALLFVFPLGMLTVGLIVQGAIFFSPTDKTQGILLFFVFPHVLTMINVVFALPWFACSVQLLINRCQNKQIDLLLEK